MNGIITKDSKRNGQSDLVDLSQQYKAIGNKPKNRTIFLSLKKVSE